MAIDLSKVRNFSSLKIVNGVIVDTNSDMSLLNMGGVSVSSSFKKFSSSIFCDKSQALSVKSKTNVPLINTGEDFTLSMWIYPDYPTYYFGWSCGDKTSYQSNKRINLSFQYLDSHYLSTGGYPVTGFSKYYDTKYFSHQWFHFAASCSNNNLKIFCDGTMTDSFDMSGRTFNTIGYALNSQFYDVMEVDTRSIAHYEDINLFSGISIFNENFIVEDRPLEEWTFMRKRGNYIFTTF